MIAALTLAATLLIQQAEALAMLHHASASPDGETQVIHQHFMLDEGGEQPTRRVWLMLQPADGGQAMPLHQPAGENAQEPRWSPNGEWIAFVGGPGYGVGEHALQIIRPDGTGLRTLAEDRQGLIKSPSWSAGVSWPLKSAIPMPAGRTSIWSSWQPASAAGSPPALTASTSIRAWPRTAVICWSPGATRTAGKVISSCTTWKPTRPRAV